MKINRDFQSPNFDQKEIPVEFLVLHYTATTIAEAIEIFQNPERKASSHLLVSQDGEIYEVVACLNEKAKRAWHAGKSSWHDGVKLWESFNDFSIGIELENLNGNAFAFSDLQYTALKELISELKIRYPALNDPNRVVGHEQIAGFRGKCDPGRCFDWSRFYNMNYPGEAQPPRPSVLPKFFVPELKLLCWLVPKRSTRRFSLINAFLERVLSIINKA